LILPALRGALVLPALRRTIGTLWWGAALSAVFCGVLAAQLLAMTRMGVAPGGIVYLGDLLLRERAHFGALRAAFLITLRRAFLAVAGWWTALAARRRTVVSARRWAAVGWRGRTVARPIRTVRIIDASAKRGCEPRKRKACEYTFHRHTFVKEVPPVATLRPVGARRQCMDIKPVAAGQAGNPSNRRAA
jgi:hypothetical protein